MNTRFAFDRHYPAVVKPIGNGQGGNLLCTGNDHRLFFLEFINTCTIYHNAQLQQTKQQMLVAQEYYSAGIIRMEILGLNVAIPRLFILNC